VGLLDPAVAPVDPPRTRADLWRDLSSAEARVIQLCEDLGDRVALLTPPPSATPAQAVVWRRRIDSAFAAAYYPWLDFGDVVTDPPIRRVPPQGVVAGLIARSEQRAGVGRAPANLQTMAVVGPSPAVSDDEWAMLHEANLDVFVRTPSGVRLMGARTLSSDPDFRYLHPRRLLSHIERLLRRRMTWAVFEPHTEALWRLITTDIETHVLRPLFERGAFAGDSPETSYFVRCDASVNPGYERDLGRVHCDIGIAPNVPAEYIVFRLAAGRELGIEITEGF
jgi:phage tail sheath protein FI